MVKGISSFKLPQTHLFLKYFITETKYIVHIQIYGITFSHYMLHNQVTVQRPLHNYVIITIRELRAVCSSYDFMEKIIHL